MKKTLLLCFVVLFAGILAAAETAENYTVPEPAYAKNRTRKVRNTFVVPGKAVFAYRGVAVSVRCYNTGTPQFSVSDTSERLGGIALMVDGKAIRGKRAANGNANEYTFDGQGTLKLDLLKDGRISFDLDLSGNGKKRLSIALVGSFFGDTRMLIDGKELPIPAYVENPPRNYQMLYKGQAASITLLAGMPEKEFGFTFDSPQDIRFVNFTRAKRLEIVLDFGTAPVKTRFLLDPGHRQISNKPAPGNRITKAADCNFWDLDRYSLPAPAGKNLLQNSSFEQGFRYLIFRDRGHFNGSMKPVSISSKEALYGQNSLQIFSIPSGKAFQPVSMQTVLLPAGKCTLSFYAKTDAPGKQTLFARLLDPVYIWSPEKAPTVTAKLTGEWKRYTLTKEWKHPTAVPVVFSVSSTADANCYIDGVMLEAGGKASPYTPPVVEGFLTTSAPDNFLEYGKKVNGAWQILAAPAASGTLNIRVRDFFDRVLLNKKFNFTADKEGRASVQLPELEKFPRGIFVVEADYSINGKKRYDIQRFSIMSFLDNTHKHKNLFVDTYVDPYTPSQNYREILDRYRLLGYGARAGFANNNEDLAKEHLARNISNAFCRIANATHKPGGKGRTVSIFRNVEYYKHNMSKKQALLAEMLERPGPHSKEFLKQVEDAAALVAATCPSIEGWTFITEPEGVLPEWANPYHASKERFRDFMDLDAAVGRGVRRGNPKAKYLLSPTSNISRPDRILYFDRVLTEAKKRGLSYDGVGAHNYRVTAPEYPVSMESEYQKIFDIMKKHGMKNIHVYSPEGMHWLPVRCHNSSFLSDYPLASAKLHASLPYTYDMSYAEKINTAYRARTWLLGLKHQDKIKQMNASNYHTFAMDALLTPYAFQKVPNTLGRLLGNARFVADIPLYPEVKCYLFEDEKGQPVAALWACAEAVDQGEESAPELFFADPPALELIDLMEASFKPEITAGKQLRLPLSPYPVFLRGKSGSTAQVKAMLEKGICKSTEPVRPQLDMQLVSPSKIAIDIRNREGVPAAWQLNFRGRNIKVSLPANQSKKLFFDLPDVVSADRQSSYELMFTLRNQQNKPLFSNRSFDALAVKHADKPIVIDGNSDDWKDYPAIPVKNLFRSNRMLRQGKFPDKKDLTADYKVAWDKNGLYLAVFVRDSNYQTAERSRIDQGWKDDSIQVFFDALADSRNTDRNRSFGVDDWSYGIFPEHGTDRQNVWRYRCPDGQLTVGVDAAKPNTVADDVQTAFKRTADGWFYEIRFSGSSLLPFVIKQGNVIGMCLLINDSDDASAPHPTWQLTNTSGKIVPNGRPDTWPLLYLSK